MEERIVSLTNEQRTILGAYVTKLSRRQSRRDIANLKSKHIKITQKLMYDIGMLRANQTWKRVETLLNSKVQAGMTPQEASDRFIEELKEKI